ncbi:MAG: Obg family GTPase CgtA [Gammaproteobacteria bacterium]
MRFADELSLRVVAGNGGDGCLSFLRERRRPKGGPDGGDGGKGGSIYLRADERLLSLSDLKRTSIFRAEHGRNGSGRNCKGRDGQDLILPVPPGTLAYAIADIQDQQSAPPLADLIQHGDLAMVARGGIGGFGNTHFKSSTNRTPRKTTAGTQGESIELRLELRILADIGLLGLPNAGKSTLLSALSKAKPKTGDYPFTTLAPQLGILNVSEPERPIAMADIPGLIEGSAHGHGLGLQFLRHLMRTRVLLHMLDVSSPDPKKDFRTVQSELLQYSAELAQKPCWLVLNKIDSWQITPTEAQIKAQEIARQLGWKGPCFAVSALKKSHTEELLDAIGNHFANLAHQPPIMLSQHDTHTASTDN